jgi:hypothetical protein
MRHESTNITCDVCDGRGPTRAVVGGDYCRLCYPRVRGLNDIGIDDLWLPVKPLRNLMAATRWISPNWWGEFAVQFLRELPMSVSENKDLVIQLAPYLGRLSALPDSLKRSESQVRGAIDAAGYNEWMLGTVAATLEEACEFMEWHRTYLERRERNKPLTGRSPGRLRADRGVRSA